MNTPLLFVLISLSQSEPSSGQPVLVPVQPQRSLSTSSPPVGTDGVQAAAAPVTSNHFDRKGQVLILGSSKLGLGGEHQSVGNASADIFEVSLALNAGYFFNAYLAAGGFLGLDVAAGGGATKVTLTIGPSLTFRAPINETMSFLPALSVGYAMIYSSPQGSISVTANGAVIDVSLPLAIEVGTGLALTVGPAVTISPLTTSVGLVSESITDIVYGVRVGLLGWL